ncbi:hypothetical protein vseg_009906 [Gypsophila vaccaria]
MSKKSSSGARSLPKFGEWDVNNPAAGEGFTVIFNAARDEKKNETNNTSSSTQSPAQDNHDKRGDKRNHNQHNDSTTVKLQTLR